MGVYVTAAAIAAQALGSIASGYATSAADKANARIAEQNAALARQNAGFAGAQGEAQAGVQGEKNAQQMGAIKAQQGASGIDVNTGSNAAVQRSAAELGQLDAMTIRSNAARAAYSFQTQATGFEGQAAIDRASAKNAVRQGYIGGITKALAGTAEAYQSGTFGSSGGSSAGTTAAGTGSGIYGASLLNPDFSNANSDSAWNLYHGSQNALNSGYLNYNLNGETL